MGTACPGAVSSVRWAYSSTRKFLTHNSMTTMRARAYRTAAWMVPTVSALPSEPLMALMSRLSMLCPAA